MVLDRRGAVAMAAGPVELCSGASRASWSASRGAARRCRRCARGREVAAERVRVRNAKTGEERMCETRAFPLHEANQLIGAVELVRDVTVEVRHDDELRRADRELTALHARLLRRAHGQAMAELATGDGVGAQQRAQRHLDVAVAGAARGCRRRPIRWRAICSPSSRRCSARPALLTRLQQLAARQPNAPPRAVVAQRRC